MKQPKLPKDPPPPSVPLVPQGPRYRYFLTPPTSVIVQAGALAAAIPEEFRAGVFDRERPIEVPCDAFLGGPAPGISLSVLNTLIPECFTKCDFSEARVRLPVQRIALAYRLIPGTEVLPEPEPEFAMPEESGPESTVVDEEATVAPEPVEEVISEATPEEAVAESEELTEPSSLEESADSPVSEKSAGLAGSTETAEPEESVESAAPVVPPEEPPAPQSVLPRARRPFSILPSFRRRKPEEEDSKEVSKEIPEPAPRARVQIPKPRTPQVPLVPPPSEANAEEVAPEEANAEDVAAASATVEAELPEPPDIPFPPVESALPAAEAKVEASPEPQEEIPEPMAPPEPARASEAMWIESKHEASPSSRALEQIPHQDGLQAVFMTEDFLGVEEVIERCGALPGVRSCVLSHGSAVLATHNVPDRVDLISLSAHAVEMVASMRASIAKMGIGAVPAVTVHSEAGPITFFNQNNLCLLIFHKDRGFVPGVREKLQQVVEELSRANLPLPLSSGPSENPSD